jgi:ferrous iron transport protein B
MALNMMDVAEANGMILDASALANLLGIPVVPVVASSGRGIPELKRQITQVARQPTSPSVQRFCELPQAFEEEWKKIFDLIDYYYPNKPALSRSESLLLLGDDRMSRSSGTGLPEAIWDAIDSSRQRLEKKSHRWNTIVIESRYVRASAICHSVLRESQVTDLSFSDKLDRVLTHKYWGLILFGLMMVGVFQSIFTFAQFPMNALDAGVTQTGNWIGEQIPAGDFRSLVIDGIIAGVGAVVVFLPQICLLFLFIGILEDTGYMARAAFIMDRVMSRVGLHGKSFIPLLSSFACAIPGIMAARTIESTRARLITILVAPLMSCSARLPVYTLLIAACIPDRTVFGFVPMQGATLFSMYILGILGALGMAWLFKRTLLRGDTPLLIMELPPYKRPTLHVVMRHVWDRSYLFLKKAGTLILGINILLWFFATYPKSTTIEQKYANLRRPYTAAAAISNAGSGPAEHLLALKNLSQLEAQERLENSFAGRMGRFIEPIIQPLGMDWRIGIGIISSFAAREVFVSTMSTIYNVGASDTDSSQSLARIMQAQIRPDGSPVYTPLSGFALMVFYVFALQCASTLAIVHKETNSWKWPLFQWLYMGFLAWISAFAIYQAGRLMGWN